MVEARSLHVLVSSHHPSADEQVADAIARVASRYAVDLTPEIEVNVPQSGVSPVCCPAVMVLITPAGDEKSQWRIGELIKLELRAAVHVVAAHDGRAAQAFRDGTPTLPQGRLDHQRT